MQLQHSIASVILIWLSCCHSLQAQKHRAEPQHIQATKEAVAKIDKKLGVVFSIPFPKNLDIDDYQKQPIGILTVGTAKVGSTRPRVNPYDGQGTVEWLVGLPNPNTFLRENITCMLHFDERGDPVQIGLLSSPEPWTTEDGVRHQLWRGEGTESGGQFIERAMREYAKRARNATNSARAEIFVTAVTRMVEALCVLRKEQK